MIKIANLNKVFTTKMHNVIALSDINIALTPGEVVFVTGASGSGKSTLLNILGGHDSDFAGNYHFFGYSVKNASDETLRLIRKDIGFIFQDYKLLNKHTIFDNLKFTLEMNGIKDSKKAYFIILDALEKVGLKEHANKYPDQLSGGQRQRVAIASALVKNPKVIIADEPTAALDEGNSNEIMKLLVELSKDKILIVASHSKSLVTRYSTRELVLKSGYLEADSRGKQDEKYIQVKESNSVENNKVGRLTKSNSVDRPYIHSIKMFKNQLGNNISNTMILTLFLLIVFISINFSNMVLQSFAPDVNYYRNYSSDSEVMYFNDETNAKFQDIGKYGENREIFTLSIADDRMKSEQFVEELLNDPSYMINYQLNLIDYIEERLINEGYEDSYYINYNTNTVLEAFDDDLIIYEDFQTIYKNYNSNPVPYTYISEISNNSDLYLFDYTLVNNKDDIISNYLIGDSRLPVKDNEVVLPIQYLFDLEVLDMDVTIVSSLEDIYNEFMKLDESFRKLKITNTTIRYDDSFNILESVETYEFDIVGLVALNESANPYLNVQYRNNIDSVSPQVLSLMVDKSALAKMYPKIDKSSQTTIKLVPNYIELTGDCNLSLSELKKEFDQVHYSKMKNNVYEVNDRYYESLNKGYHELSIFIDDHLSGDMDSIDAILQLYFDPINYPGIDYEILLRTYIMSYFVFDSDQDKLASLCPSCEDNSTETVYNNALDIYSRIVQYGDIYGVLNNFGNSNTMAQRYANNVIFYDTNAENFNSFYRASSQDDEQRSSVYIGNVFEQNKDEYDNNKKLDLGIFSKDYIFHYFHADNVYSNSILTLVVTTSLLLVVSYILIRNIFKVLYSRNMSQYLRARRREIFTMKTQGTSNSDVKRILRYETLIIFMLTIILTSLMVLLLQKLAGLLESNKYSYSAYIPLFNKVVYYNIKSVFEPFFVSALFLLGVSLYLINYRLLKKDLYKKLEEEYSKDTSFFRGDIDD